MKKKEKNVSTVAALAPCRPPPATHTRTTQSANAPASIGGGPATPGSAWGRAPRRRAAAGARAGGRPVPCRHGAGGRIAVQHRGAAGGAVRR